MNQECYREAYFQGRWVYVLMRYVPPEATIDGVKRPNLYDLPAARCCDDARQKIVALITEIIDPETLPDKKLRRLCRYNDIPLAWVSKKFNRKKLCSTDTDLKKSSRKRKNAPLNAVEFKSFVQALRSIDKQAALIAQIIWYLNRKMSLPVPLEALLRLKVTDVAPEDDLSTWIRLRYFSNGISCLSVCRLPAYLWKGLCRHITSHSYIVFSNKKGAPLLVGDLNKLFVRAGKKAVIKREVTSLALRLDKGHKEKSLFKKLHLNLEDDVSDISAFEWEHITSHVPSLRRKRGRKPKYDQRDVFNCILFHMRECVTVRRASAQKSIPEDVVESQLRRWRASGIIKEVLSARKMLRT